MGCGGDEEGNDRDPGQSHEKCDGADTTALTEHPGIEDGKDCGGASNAGVGADDHECRAGVTYDRGRTADTILPRAWGGAEVLEWSVAMRVAPPHSTRHVAACHAGGAGHHR